MNKYTILALIGLALGVLIVGYLDALYNFGIDTDLTEAGEAARAELKTEYDDDDLVCLSAYVNAYRNTIGAYAN